MTTTTGVYINFVRNSILSYISLLLKSIKEVIQLSNNHVLAQDGHLNNFKNSFNKPF